MQPRSGYVYNRLNWRITKRADTGGTAGTLNLERRMYYSANWQLVEEEIDDDFAVSFSVDRRMQYFWGQRYIDDIVMRRQDVGNDGIWNDTWYHITDTLFSTVAIIDQNANLIERVSYDAYGNARHHRMGDLIGDGATTTDDRNLLRGNTGNYGVGDLNRDGIVDSADLALLDNDTGGALPAGQLSAGASGTDNIIGYAGYIFNAEIPGAGLYTVRHRHYAPDLGRWLSRDPLGYVDGMGLYEYVRGRAIGSLDPYGLQSKGDTDSFNEWMDNLLDGIDALENRPEVGKRCNPGSDEDVHQVIHNVGEFGPHKTIIVFGEGGAPDVNDAANWIDVCKDIGWTIWQRGKQGAPGVPISPGTASDMGDGKARVYVRASRKHVVKIVTWSCQDRGDGVFVYMPASLRVHKYMEVVTHQLTYPRARPSQHMFDPTTDTLVPGNLGPEALRVIYTRCQQLAKDEFCDQDNQGP